MFVILFLVLLITQQEFVNKKSSVKSLLIKNILHTTTNHQGNALKELLFIADVDGHLISASTVFWIMTGIWTLCIPLTLYVDT